MTTPEREDERRRHRLLLLLGSAVLVLLLGVLLGYVVLGQDPAEGTGGPRAAGVPQPVLVQPSSRPGSRPSEPPVVVEGTGQAASQRSSSTGTAQTGTGATLVATSRVVGQVAPGRPATLDLTLTNPGARAVQVMTVSARITSVAGRAPSAGPACSTSWYDVGSFTGPTTVPSLGSATVRLAITFDDSPTVNQDSCKGARYTYAYRVEARQV